MCMWSIIFWFADKWLQMSFGSNIHNDVTCQLSHNSFSILVFMPYYGLFSLDLHILDLCWRSCVEIMLIIPLDSRNIPTQKQITWSLQSDHSLTCSCYNILLHEDLCKNWKDNIKMVPKLRNYIKDILNKNNDLLSHQELVNKYNIRTTFLDTLTLNKCIPADWLKNLRHSSINALDVHTT